MLKKLLKKLLQSFIDKPLPAMNEIEKDSLLALKEKFQNMDVLDASKAQPSESEWFGYTNRLRELVLDDDPREFLRWDVIRGTMFVSSARYIRKELKHLKKDSGWESRWKGAINESYVGHPIPYTQYPASSGTLIHHTYHVALFEEKTGTTVNDYNVALEFGGGYGGMCRLFFNLGFKGRYIIFDLQPFSWLQEYYLKSSGFPILTVDNFNDADTGVLCLSDHEQLAELLNSVNDKYRSVFIATWSLSESPVETRQNILPLIDDFDSYLIAYQHQFNEVDNIEFFGSWKQQHQAVQWHEWSIEHLRNTSSYLIGKRSR